MANLLSLILNYNAQSQPDMERILLSLVLVFLGLKLAAQANYSLKTQQIERDRKSRYYVRQANRLMNGNNYLGAALNAATALKVAKKRRHKSRAQRALNEVYPEAIERSERLIEQLKNETATFSGDETVTKSAQLVRVYRELIRIQNILGQLPKKAFKPARRRDSGFQYEPLDFSDDLTAAKTAFEESKTQAAVMHYEEGRRLERSGDKTDQKEAAKRFIRTQQYVKNYRDSRERYQSVKKAATTRMGITPFDASNVEHGNMGIKMSQLLLEGLMSMSSQLDFFEVVDREQLDAVLKEQKFSLSGLLDESTTAEIGALKGVDVLLAGTITESVVDRQKTGPDEHSYSREVVIGKEKYTDEEGNERTREVLGTVTATARELTKTAEATVGCSFKVIDVKTGDILETGSMTGHYYWEFFWISKFTGDKRALPRGVPRREERYPGTSIMTNLAAEEVAGRIMGQLQKYLNKVGR